MPWPWLSPELTCWAPSNRQCGAIDPPEVGIKKNLFAQGIHGLLPIQYAHESEASLTALVYHAMQPILVAELVPSQHLCAFYLEAFRIAVAISAVSGRYDCSSGLLSRFLRDWLYFFSDDSKCQKTLIPNGNQ